MEKQTITREAVQQVLRDYWEQYRARPWWAFFGFMLPAVGTIFVFYVPPLVIAELVDIFAEHGHVSINLVNSLLLWFATAWLLGEVFWRIGMHYQIKLEATGLTALGQTAFSRLSGRDYEFYADHFVGSLTKKAIAFSRSFETFTDTMSFNVVTGLVPMIFATIILWGYSPWIPIILIVSLIVVVIVALPIIRRRSHLVALRHDASSRVSGRLSDAMTNMLTIKSFAKERNELNSYREHVEDFTAKFKRAADYHNLRFDMAISPLYVGVNVIGLIAAIYFIDRLGLQPGAIVVVFTYYSLITRIFWEINRIYRNIESSISEAAEFTQLFIEAPSVRDAPHAQKLKVREAAVRFDRVHFAYSDVPSTSKPFLNDFSLEIRGNEKVGLVGPSGGGKTTITKLLLRFVDTRQGDIRIDNQSIKSVTQESLRKMIAYVPQEPLLFHRSLLDNIAYGSEHATAQDVIKAAKLAQADEFIRRLPNGYETYVGERGVKLSGGQRQRVAIARAILKNAPILILDEATSSLDSESEKYIQKGLWALMKNKTALVIAHRLSTIRHLDRIIVLDKGRIVQDGTHDELTAQKGMYANLWKHQSGGFLESA